MQGMEVTFRAGLLGLSTRLKTQTLFGSGETLSSEGKERKEDSQGYREVCSLEMVDRKLTSFLPNDL